jgi:hypothetical protein
MNMKNAEDIGFNKAESDSEIVAEATSLAIDLSESFIS